MDSDGERSAGRRAAVAGVVVEQLPSALYRVKLDEGSQVTAHSAGADRPQFHPRAGRRPGPVELSPVDTGRGRIVEKL